MSEPKKEPVGRKLVLPPKDWVVRCPHAASVRGFVDARFLFLEEWLGPDAGKRLLGALQTYSDQFKCASTTYVTRDVLEHWRTLDAKGGNFCSDIGTVVAFLAQLRKDFIQTRFKEGVALSTLGRTWSAFLGFLPHAKREGLLPHVDISNPVIGKIPESMTLLPRNDVAGLKANPALAPRTISLESDSYNDRLFESLSIAASGESYLVEYELRLATAVNTIKSAALRDFELLESKFESRHQLAELAAPLLTWSNPDGLLSSWTKMDFREADHMLVGLLINFVNKKMMGVPKAWVQPSAHKLPRPAGVSPTDCRKLVSFGKNQLLPYLGILTSEAAMVCLVLLICEHPQLNSTTLSRAQLLWEGGRQLITIETIGGEQRKRLSATKPRAKSEKSVILSPLAARVIDRVIEWTRSTREAMIEEGRLVEANRLWIGMNLSNYDLIAFSHSALTSGFNRSHRDLADEPERERLYSFVELHPELMKWADRLNLKNLRVNVGVLDYLRSGGDLSRAATTFGHKDIQTTLDDYIPAALRHAIYERQVRRHQNLLIAASFGGDGAPLRATDFKTTSELFEFLRGIFESLPEGSIHPLRDALAAFLNRSEPEMPVANPTTSVEDGSSLILNSNPKYLSIAMLYRDHIANASSDFLDKPDPGTKIPPRFWLEFVNSLNVELPNSLTPLKLVVKKAAELKSTLKSTVIFPDIW